MIPQCTIRSFRTQLRLSEHIHQSVWSTASHLLWFALSLTQSLQGFTTSQHNACSIILPLTSKASTWWASVTSQLLLWETMENYSIHQHSLEYQANKSCQSRMIQEYLWSLNGRCLRNTRLKYNLILLKPICCLMKRLKSLLHSLLSRRKSTSFIFLCMQWMCTTTSRT